MTEMVVLLVLLSLLPCCGERSGPQVILTGTTTAQLGDKVDARLGTADRVTIVGMKPTSEPLYTFVMIEDRSAVRSLIAAGQSSKPDDQGAGVHEEFLTIGKDKWHIRLEYFNGRMQFGTKWYNLSNGDVFLVTWKPAGDFDVHQQFRNVIPYDPSAENTVAKLAALYPQITTFVEACGGRIPSDTK